MANAMTAVNGGPLTLFYSYSHRDEQLRDDLESHLSMLKRQGVISGWHDRQIIAGEDWGEKIDEHLNSADLILLLTSSDLLASAYCYDIEVARAMERHEAKHATVIPIILRPCDWHSAPFGKLEALPKDAKPVTLWENRDEAFLDIVKGIRSAVASIQERARPSVSSTDTRQRIRGVFIPDVLRVAFVNRKDRDGGDILERIKTELRPDSNHFVTLWGAGGVGKTSIAAEAARMLTTDYHDRVLWISADGRQDFSFSTLLDEIAVQLGAADLRKLVFEEKQNLIRETVSSKPTLVVLDNFETINPQESRLCEEWFMQPALCSALVTTRQFIGGAYRNIPVDPMGVEEAKILLQRSIREAHDSTAFSKIDGDRIVQVSEGNPLVLQWVVRQIDLAQDAEEVLEDLRRGEGTAAERVFDRSFRLKQLGKGGRRVLLALSLFVGTAGRKGLATVAGFDRESNKKKFREAIKTLSSLWLLRTANSGDRLALDGLTREFTKSRLVRDADYKIFLGRYVTLYEKFLGTNSEATAAALNALELEKDNALNAIEGAFQLQRNSTALHMCAHLDDFLFLRGYWDQAEVTARQALNTARALSNGKQIVTFTHSIGRIYEQRGRLNEARDLFTEGLEFARGVAPNKLNDLLNHLTTLAQAHGDLTEARRINTENLQIAISSKDQWGVAASLHQLGLLSLKDRDLIEARKLLSQSLVLLRELKTQTPSIAECLESLGNLEVADDSFAQAGRYLNEALQLAEALGDKSRIASVKHSLALLAEKQSNRPQALQFLYESLALFAELGSLKISQVRTDLRRIALG